MAYEINFSLLGAPVDIGAAVNAGYERGRQMRMQGQQESAFAMLARDPNSAEGRALLTASGRPDLARQFRTWAKQDRNEDFQARALGMPPRASALAPAAPVATTPSAFAPSITPVSPAGAPPAAVPPASGGMTPPAVSVPPAASTGPGQPDPQIMRQWFATDPAGAREFLTTWNALNETQREIATQRFTAAIPVLTQALSVPQAQRRAFIMSQSADLMANGWSQQEIEGFDPTDTNVQLMIRRGLPIAQQRDFFAPIEGGQGETYRNRFSLNVEAANPSAPRTESYTDEAGNEITRTIPGTPAIGPGAELFGAGAQGGQVQTAVPQVGEVRRGYRFKGGDPASPQSWEPVGTANDEAPAFRPAPGGAGSRPRTFP